MPEFLDILKENEGIAVRSIKRPEGWERKVKEVVDLLNNTNRLAPHRREYLINEALTTSDFPYLFGDALDRTVLATYKATEPVWKQYMKLGTTSRIYPQVGGRRFLMTGGDNELDEVPEKGEYPASDRAESKFDIYVRKYGRQFDISWEAIINDDIGALKDTADRFARAAMRTEHRLAVTAYAGDVGTHAGGNLYQNAVNEDVLALTIGNLETCVERMAAFVDANGEPIAVRPKFLVVGPANEFTARQILTSTTKMWLADSDDVTPPAAYPMTNVISQIGLVLVVDPYIPIVDTDGAGSWYLFADPNELAAVECDHLTGHETPEICMKASNKVAIGGGPVSPMEGDFETDNVFYRVRDVFGANKLDWRGTYANIHA